MENEKIVEEKNVEKKPKKKIDGITIFLIIVALAAIIGIAYLYFYTDILTPYESYQLTDKTGSSYVGEYVLDSDFDYNLGQPEGAELIDGEWVADNQTLYLNADGTCYVIDHNNGDSKGRINAWEETEDGFCVNTLGGYDAGRIFDAVLQADGRFRYCYDHNNILNSDGECQRCHNSDGATYWRKVN